MDIVLPFSSSFSRSLNIDGMRQHARIRMEVMKNATVDAIATLIGNIDKIRLLRGGQLSAWRERSSLKIILLYSSRSDFPSDSSGDDAEFPTLTVAKAFPAISTAKLYVRTQVL